MQPRITHSDGRGRPRPHRRRSQRLVQPRQVIVGSGRRAQRMDVQRIAVAARVGHPAHRVEVRHPNGKTGIFDMTGAHVEGEVVNADAHMCNWIGGKIAPGEENTPTRFASASAADFRADAARDRREMMRPQWGDAIDQFSDADMIDAIFYSVFPNLHPWADFNPIFYRFRPDGSRFEVHVNGQTNPFGLAFDEFVPLGGDRHYGEDEAIIGGFE